MTIPLSSKTPTEPGLYLFSDLYGSQPELVTVYWRHPPDGYFDSTPYLAVSGRIGRPVENLKGIWSEKIDLFWHHYTHESR